MKICTVCDLKWQDASTLAQAWTYGEGKNTAVSQGKNKPKKTCCPKRVLQGSRRNLLQTVTLAFSAARGLACSAEYPEIST